MTAALVVLGASARMGYADFRATQTWQTWLFGWLLRLLLQMAFFGLAARMYGSTTAERYVLVGNAVAVVILETTAAVLAASADRAYGTVPLLAVAPVPYALVSLGRSALSVVTGTANAAVALLCFSWLLGVALPWQRAVAALPVVLAVGVASYAYATFLAGVAIRHLATTWIVINVGYLVVFTFAGVNVPVTFWPRWLEAVTEVMPLRHGLGAVRACLDGAPVTEVLAGVGAELLVGAGWLALALASFHRLVSRGRADGSLDFSE